MLIMVVIIFCELVCFAFEILVPNVIEYYQKLLFNLVYLDTENLLLVISR